MIIDKVEHDESKFVVACFSHLGAQIIAETYLKVSAQLEWRRVQNNYCGARWEVMTVEEYNQRVAQLKASGGVK
jgi:hypothetical protein